MRETVVIDRRFRGPPESGNGGYCCGLLAGLVGGPAECTLRAPPPLATPLAVERQADGQVLVRHGERLIAEAVPARIDVEVPAPVDLATAELAARGYVGFHRHPYPGCFVCGPERGEADGLRIFPGAVPGRELAAAPWIPDASLAGDDGLVRAEIVWAALDCPSWFGANAFERYEGNVLLGRLAGEVLARPRSGQACVALGWRIASQGRKVTCGSALFSGEGALLGRARATWIKPA
jgi:hypothetical protein